MQFCAYDQEGNTRCDLCAHEEQCSEMYEMEKYESSKGEQKDGET